MKLALLRNKNILIDDLQRTAIDLVKFFAKISNHTNVKQTAFYLDRDLDELEIKFDKEITLGKKGDEDVFSCIPVEEVIPLIKDEMRIEKLFEFIEEIETIIKTTYKESDKDLYQFINKRFEIEPEPAPF